MKTIGKDKVQVETMVWIGAYALAFACITHAGYPASVRGSATAGVKKEIDKMDEAARLLADRATQTIVAKLEEMEATPK